MSKATLLKRLKWAVLVIGLVALIGGATANATRMVAGNLVVDLEVNFTPKALPRSRNAPIKVWGFERLQSRDGAIPPPTTHLGFEFNKDGSVETRGLPTCPRRKLIATTTEQARGVCGGAIVGRGFAKAVIALPEQAPIAASTSLTFFNAPPVDGDPALIVHGHLDVPVPTTYLDLVRIKRIHRGSLGYQVESDTARIAGGYGSVTFFRFGFNRRWRFKGEELSFISAHCATAGPHLLGHGETRFADGTAIHGSLFTSCRVR